MGGSNLFTPVCNGSTINVKPCQNFGEAVVQQMHNLIMSNRILGYFGDGIFRTNNGSLGDDCISNFGFDLLDFLNCLFFVEAVDEQVNV